MPSGVWSRSSESAPRRPARAGVQGADGLFTMCPADSVKYSTMRSWTTVGELGVERSLGHGGRERIHHGGHPVLACGRIDPEGRVAHAQAWMATLLGVGVGSSPVLAEEGRQPLARGAQVDLVGVQRQQHGVVRDVVVEALDQTVEEPLAADRLEHRDLVGGLLVLVGSGAPEPSSGWLRRAVGVSLAVSSSCTATSCSMWGRSGQPGYDPGAMGQPVSVIEKPSSQGGVVRYEINRTLTGMGHERYLADQPIEDDRPPDELARRLFERGGIDGHPHQLERDHRAPRPWCRDRRDPRDHRGPLHLLPAGCSCARPRRTSAHPRSDPVTAGRACLRSTRRAALSRSGLRRREVLVGLLVAVAVWAAVACSWRRRPPTARPAPRRRRGRP